MKDLENHTNTCALIDLTCDDCQLVYKRSNAHQEHTEIMCLRRQIQQLRGELNENVDCVAEEIGCLKTFLTMGKYIAIQLWLLVETIKY